MILSIILTIKNYLTDWGGFLLTIFLWPIFIINECIIYITENLSDFEKFKIFLKENYGNIYYCIFIILLIAAYLFWWYNIK